jgi:predicted CXXCH cytochrome family protein
MKTRVTLAIIIVATGFLIVICCKFVSAIDAPHNDSNTIYCGSCHGQTILNSPFWGGSGTYDQICQSCHYATSGGPYSDVYAPFEETHSSATTSTKYGDWARECIDCHDPHYQLQKNYKNTDPNNYYIAKGGTITSCVYTCPVCPQVVGTTTLTYSTITYRNGWDPTDLSKKTEDYRGAILFPSIGKLGFNYPIIEVDTPIANTITVDGNAAAFLCPSQTYSCNPPCCDDPSCPNMPGCDPDCSCDPDCPLPQTYSCTPSSPPFTVMYGQYVKNNIDVSGTSTPVKFFDQTGINSFADGDGTYNGVCEVCHTLTTHFRYGGGVSEQNHENICEGVKTNCIRCHKHTNGFGHGGGGSETNCVDCHGHDKDWTGGSYSGTTVSHSTHTENDDDDLRGPLLACSDCHDTEQFPCSTSGVDSNGDGAYNLSETNVCDECHSPSGYFDGVDTDILTGSIGAKDNWGTGVYQADSTLTPGKEKWCAGCHDDVPSVVDGITAPDIVGDNSTYGYYLSSNAHSNGTYGVSRQSLSYSKGECVHCHDVSKSGHGGQLFNTSIGFCLKCHDNTTTYATTAIKNRSYSYRAGNYSDDTLDSIENFYTNPPYISSHGLTDIKTFINGKWGYDANSNACAACHNPHKVQGDPEHSDAAKSPSTRGYPVVRPSQHATNYNNLWGDDPDEKMSNYSNKYQAPYRFGSTTAFEPDGSETTNGSNLTDYATFCTDCHNTTYTTINSTPLGRYLYTFDWANEMHGGYAATYCGVGGPPPTTSLLAAPYDGINKCGEYVLSCTDCHEPHGSTNNYLVRKEVNNGTVTVTQYGAGNGSDGRPNKEWMYLCDRCHTYLSSDVLPDTHHQAFIISQIGCTTCHPHGGDYRNCMDCHFHGNNKIPIPVQEGGGEITWDKPLF